MIYYESELYHYGVPGMKWGHRKTQASSGSGRGFGYYRKAANKGLDMNVGWKAAHAPQKVMKTSKKQMAISEKYEKRANRLPAGTRRALKSQYKSDLYKATSKANESLAKSYDKTNKQIMNYRANSSHGKNVAKRIILNQAGRNLYDLNRSKGYSRGKSTVDMLLQYNGLKRNDYQKAYISANKQVKSTKKELKANYRKNVINGAKNSIRRK